MSVEALQKSSRLGPDSRKTELPFAYPLAVSKRSRKLLSTPCDESKRKSTVCCRLSENFKNVLVAAVAAVEQVLDADHPLAMEGSAVRNTSQSYQEANKD